MGNYTPEQVEAIAASVAAAWPKRDPLVRAERCNRAAEILRAYAATLRQAARVDEDGLREAAQEALGLLRMLDPQHGVTQQLEAALSAQPAERQGEGVAPKHGDRHDGCTGFWCDVVEAEYKKPGRIVQDESNVERYVRIGLMCDKCGVERQAHSERARVLEGNDYTVDEVAEVMSLLWLHCSSVPDDRLRQMEHQLLSATHPAAPVGVPDGMVLVPREPTSDQLRDGACQVSGLTHSGAEWVYRAMLAAAPSQRAEVK